MTSKTWWRRLFGRATAPELDPSDTDLVEVVSSFDDAEACSTALERATGWTPQRPAVLRHLLRLPAAQVESAAAIAAQDGYTVHERGAGDPCEVVLQRVQLLDALHCSQERARMAGLAQRHDGTALGWTAWQ
ncbi:hypothetical protein [Nocardia otitidiscaviarum]|uniref:hypothetical protein n=1 Tax=Nocardia otitidiscaviarum TaxID=1823 RepID=UPI001894BEF5|nr:hypothetical protein [Nocardia otitidiscaviarum]MBF6177121.1 hypothetical protein [Nocardia otitidiscaviarum]